MFKIGDKVVVNKSHHSSYVGKGIIEGICNDINNLHNYFQEDHPFYPTYFSWLNSNKTIYIVQLEDNIGRAGFLTQELTLLENEIVRKKKLSQKD